MRAMLTLVCALVLLVGCASSDAGSDQTSAAAGAANEQPQPEPTDEDTDSPSPQPTTAEPTADPGDDPTPPPAEETTGEPVADPTEETTDEATEQPAGDSEEEATEEPDEEPADGNNETDEESQSELDDLRTIGGAAEPLVDAADQEDIDNWLHSAWGMEHFRPQVDETSEWVNADELWDEIMHTVWDRAVDEYGDRLRHEPGTIWDGRGGDSPGQQLPRPAYGRNITATIDHGDHGFRMWVWVGVDPEDPEQARPDAAVYNVQVVGDEEAPGLWRGELHRVIGMCVVSGELTWSEEWGGEVWEAVDSCESQDLDEHPWETFEEVQGEQ